MNWLLAEINHRLSSVFRNDGGGLHVGISRRQAGAPQGPGRFPDGQRAVWKSGQRVSVVLALPAAAVRQWHRVSASSPHRGLCVTAARCAAFNSSAFLFTRCLNAIS